MTKDNLVTVPVGTTLEEAERLLQEHRIEKLLVVDQQFNLKGLITVKDIQKKLEYPRATKDEQGRLRVGGAVGATGDFLERAVELYNVKADLLALDTESGRVLWTNDDAGRIYMPQPHGGANAESGVSAQGYLVATADRLLVPTGRAVPAGFLRDGGKFLYYHLQANGHVGGTQTVAAGSSFYNGGNAFNVATGATEDAGAAGAPGAFAQSFVQETKECANGGSGARRRPANEGVADTVSGTVTSRTAPTAPTAAATARRRGSRRESRARTRPTRRRRRRRRNPPGRAAPAPAQRGCRCPPGTPSASAAAGGRRRRAAAGVAGRARSRSPP